MYILGIDPGERNGAWSVVNVEPKKVSIVYWDHFYNPIANLTNHPQENWQYKKDPNTKRRKKHKLTSTDPEFMKGLAAYDKEVSSILRNFPDIEALCIERFQPRSVQSKSSETVSLMNGIVALKAKSKGIPTHLTPAATWKNAVNKVTDLDRVYNRAEIAGEVRHPVDSTLIAMWHGCFLIERDLPTSIQVLNLVSSLGDVE